MAIRKNKKRFDPRYFMDEKMEESSTIKEARELHAPRYDPSEQVRWEQEQERKKKEKEEKDVPRGSEDVDYSLEEGDLSHLADPAVWEALGQGLAHLAKIWVPLIGTAGFAIVAKDAIEYLKGGSKLEDALQQAAAKAESGQEELNEVNEPAVFLSQVKPAMEAQLNSTIEDLKSKLDSVMGGTSVEEYSEDQKNKIKKEIEKKISELEEDFDKKFSAMAKLMTPQVVRALETIADNSQAVGDIHMKLGARALSDGRIDKLEPSTRNLLKILKVLGKYQREWDR